MQPALTQLAVAPVGAAAETQPSGTSPGAGARRATPQQGCPVSLTGSPPPTHTPCPCLLGKGREAVVGFLGCQQTHVSSRHMERGWERTRVCGELMRAGRVSSSSSSRLPRSWASPLAGEGAPSTDRAALGRGSSPESPGARLLSPARTSGRSFRGLRLDQRHGQDGAALGTTQILFGPWGTAPNPVFGDYPPCTAAGRAKGSGRCSSHPHHRAQGEQRGHCPGKRPPPRHGSGHGDGPSQRPEAGPYLARL